VVLGTLKRMASQLRVVLADLDPERLSGSDAAELLEAFSDLEKLAAGGKLLTARRVDSSKIWRKTGHRSAASLLADTVGTAVGPAVDTLEAARRLRAMPAAEEAIRGGRLSEVQVKEIASAASLVPDAEEDLVQAAVNQSVSVLKLRCRRLKATGSGAATTYRAIHRARYLRNWVDRDGSVRLDGKLTPDAGARLLGAVRAQTERLSAAARRAGVREPERALAADALVRLACGRDQGDDSLSGSESVAVDGAEGPGRVRVTRPRSVGSGAAGRRSGRRRPVKPVDVDAVPRTMVHVRVDHAALVRGHTKPGEVCEIPGIGPIPVEVARDLAGDSILTVLLTDGVDVTAVAHAGRTIPASVRRALIERDPVCVVPGCEVRDGLEIDHVVPFGEGGGTTLANLVRLCHWHHYLKTHQRHRLERRGRQWAWIPPGTEVTPRLC